MTTTGRARAVPSALLAAGDRQVLLQLARRAVVAAAAGDASPPVDHDGLPAALRAPGAAFVTLHLNGRLRGCIGTVEPRDLPLADTVVMMARAAACEDPRFAPVQPDEVPALEVEISVLGPLVPVASPAEVQIGRDGLVAEEGHRRGLLLPQVPVEWGWDRETFLRQACVKAGLPSDAWEHRARLFRFTAEVFGEAAHPGSGDRHSRS
jgi:AmmeMemoRadiSam system protein A